MHLSHLSAPVFLAHLPTCQVSCNKDKRSVEKGVSALHLPHTQKQGVLALCTPMPLPSHLEAATYKAHQAVLSFPHPPSQTAWDNYELEALRWAVSSCGA